MGEIFLILSFSLFLSVLCRKVNLPVVVGQLAVGIILGPALLNWIHSADEIAILAELGVIFLMFLAGLESDINLLKRNIKPAATVAICGVIVPLFCFAILGHLLGYQFNQSFFLGIVFAATSVSITVEVLNEYKALKSNSGATILGAAVVDDILAVLILSFFISSIGIQSTSGLSLALPIQILLELLFVFLIYILARYLAPYLLRLAKRLPVYAASTMISVILCLGLAYAAELVGMSDVIGAFFAGVIVSQSQAAEEIESRVSTIAYVIFIPIFFASIGLNMSFDGLSKNLILIIVMTLLAIATKVVPAALAAKRFGFKTNEALLIGSGMVSRGEMALIVLKIGLSAHLLEQTSYSSLVIVIILTTLIAPFMIKWCLKSQA